MDPADTTESGSAPADPGQTPAPAGARRRPRWLLPLIGLGALVGLGWWLLASQTGPTAPVDEAVPVTTTPEKTGPPPPPPR